MRRVLSLAAVVAVTCLALVPAMSGQSQKGRLRILRHGQPIGAESYEITATATETEARSETEITAGDMRLRQSTRLRLSAAMTPQFYEWKQEQPADRWLRMEFNANSGTIHFAKAGGKEEQQIYQFASAKLALLDNNVFHHFLLLTRLYDYSSGGPQKIGVFIPQSVQPGEVTVELKGVEAQSVDGESQPVREFAITTPDNRLQLWVTESGRLVRLTAPLEGIEILPDLSSR